MKIWAKYQGKTELVDECAAKDARTLVREYQVAFGPNFIVWSGNKGKK